MSSPYEKALPEINNLTLPFWESCKKHQMKMQFCTSCNEWIWYPRAACPYCGGRDQIQWKHVSGSGTIYSFTIIRQVIDNSPAFQKEIPFAIGLIELEEGPRFYSNVAGSLDDLRIGDIVEIYYDDVTPDITLPKFKRVGK